MSQASMYAEGISDDARAILGASLMVVILRSAVELEATLTTRAAPLSDAQLQTRHALTLRLRSLAKDLAGFTGEVMAEAEGRGIDPDQRHLRLSDRRATRALAQADGTPT